jgi:hypothetical protein
MKKHGSLVRKEKTHSAKLPSLCSCLCVLIAATIFFTVFILKFQNMNIKYDEKCRRRKADLKFKVVDSKLDHF